MTKSGKTSYKVILLGDPAVGKSSIRRRYLGQGFSGSYDLTLGADFAVKRMGNRILQIWDLAGHKIFKNIREVYYAGAEGIILVFDLTRLDTLNNLYSWIEEATNLNKSKLPFVVVGNKSDLFEPESLQEIYTIVDEFMQELSNYNLTSNIRYIETSALLGKNIEDVFENLIAEMDLIYAENLGIDFSVRDTETTTQSQNHTEGSNLKPLEDM